MPKYICSFAYDIPHYVDFVVEAKSERVAKRIIEKALRDGKFANVPCDACYDNQHSDRVFVGGLTAEHETETTMEELIGMAVVELKGTQP